MRIVIIRLLLLLIALGRLNSVATAANSGGLVSDVVQVVLGSSIAFSASAESESPATFQWRKNGVNIAGATSNTLRLQNITLADMGVYSAVASNSKGSTLSNALTIAVGDAAGAVVTAVAPVITSQPLDLQSLLLGGGGVFQVTATGTPAPTYQWLKDGVPISGATSPTLSLANILSGEYYSVVVSNSAGSVVSRAASLSPLNLGLPSLSGGTAPVITREPADLQAQYGSNVTFSVAATGSPEPTYAWMKDGATISGATGRFLSVPGVTSNAGYSAVVTNSAGSVTSRVATLTVAGQPAAAPVAVAPAFTTEPSGSVQVAASTPVTFTAAASGSPTPTYQWRKNGTNISGATQASFTLGSATLDDAGRYSVVASNSVGSIFSSEAELSVVMAPQFASHPVSQAVTAGDSVTFSAGAIGFPAPSYQWTRNGTDISGASSATLHLSQVTKNDEGSYVLYAWNGFGSTASNGASLLVQTPYAPAADPHQPLSGPIAGVVLRANYTFTLAPGTKRTVGFLIRDSSRKILVRAVGPTLTTLGNGGAMADPVIELFSGLNVIAQNDNWGGGFELMQAFSQAGATPFASGDSRDAALVTTVAPGAYSAVISSADGQGGTVLVEVYEFP
jgi:hypothetical protein